MTSVYKAAIVLSLAIAAIAIGFTATGQSLTTEVSPSETEPTSIEVANPASTYCIENGGSLDLATGICTLPDGTVCEEWAYFRGECPESMMGESTQIANPASVYCTEQGGTLTLVSTEEGVIGECELADGTVCEEWAYFRGECGASMEVTDANPASVYCTEQGGTLTLVSTEEGVIGECELADGTVCEEWAYFRGECGESTEEEPMLRGSGFGDVADDCSLRGPGVDLHGCDLSNADLRGADLSNADLSNANLSNADLRGADLSNANLSNADLRGADLSNADLRGADLSNADFTGSNLEDAKGESFVGCTGHRLCE